MNIPNKNKVKSEEKDLVKLVQGPIKAPKNFDFDYKRELNEIRDKRFKKYLK